MTFIVIIGIGILVAVAALVVLRKPIHPARRRLNKNEPWR